MELWREDAGTAAICGYGLPPDAALAADQAITAAALALKTAGLPGTMDQLRARAYLDALLGMDSRPTPSTTAPSTKAPGTEPGGAAAPGAGPADAEPAADTAGPWRGACRRRGSTRRGARQPGSPRRGTRQPGSTRRGTRRRGSTRRGTRRPGADPARPQGPARQAGPPRPAAAINLTMVKRSSYARY